MNLIFVLAVIALAVAMVVGGVIASRLLAPRVPGATKASPYECGESPIGPGQIQFKPGYYLIALLFLVFDVEALFLYPWAVTIRHAGWLGLTEIGVFIAILVAGLAFAYRKGALEWH